MNIFVTGASGFVGSAVVAELLQAGHSAVGLARSDAAAEKVAGLGAEVLRGSLEDLDLLMRAAAEADGVVHCGFNHDFSKFMDNCATDRRAIEALGNGLEGSGKPLIATSGLAFLKPGQIATEADTPPAEHKLPRVSERTALAFAARGVRAMAIRLAPTVHGEGDHGFVPALIAMARNQGSAAYVGDGLNRWPAVHRLDAARLYLLALEKGEAGATWHAVGEEGLAFKDIAAAIGAGLGLPVVSVPPDKAGERFAWLAMFAGVDTPASSARTRETLGWRPTGPTLFEDLRQPSYFAA